MTSRRERWTAVGRSEEPDAAGAAAEAMEGALAGPDPKLLIVFASEQHDLPALLTELSSAAPDVPLVGCTTAGEIATAGPGDASVVVMALGGSGISASTAVASGASADLRSAGARAAACFDGLDERSHSVLLVLTDGLSGDQQEIVRGAYGAVGAGVPLVGGCAGDDLRMTATHQFHGDAVHTDAVVAAAISSDGPIGIGVRHGWRRVGGDPMLVTRSAANRVYTLDEQPALDVYLDRLDAPDDARTDPAAFTRFAITHPLGLSRRGDEEVRFIGEADFEDRSLGCIAEVPEGGLAWFMEGDDASVLAATDEACSEALAALDGSQPIGVVAFDCIARRGVLGDVGIKTEVERLADKAAGAPVVGFYTYGEIARTKGVRGFHNQTLVVLAMG